MLQLRRSRASTAVIPAAALLMLSFGPAAAQSVANFYSGKTVNMLIGFTAGGGFDLYARTVARYLGRYIPRHCRIRRRGGKRRVSDGAAQHVQPAHQARHGLSRWNRDDARHGAARGRWPLRLVVDEPAQPQQGAA